MNITTNALGVSSTNFDQNNKRSVLHPLNVYLRIRPFIGDELQRGENQHLIDIIDEKHIAIKLNPTLINTIRSRTTYAVTKIFDETSTQENLFDEILRQPIDEIFNGNNLLFSTLGLTNSGKTHTMFGTSDQPGLIPKCLERIFINIGDKFDQKLRFKPDGLENFISTETSDLKNEIRVRNYIFPDAKCRTRLPNLMRNRSRFDDSAAENDSYSVWFSFFELYNENILDLLVQPTKMSVRPNLRLMQNETSTIIKNLIQIPVFDQNEAEELIKFGFANRSTSKTNLNEASSRSHAIVCLTLIKIDEFNAEATLSHLYICDLAGNEPSSIGTGKQLIETCRINTSLMTFKDCIRVLNENHTSKKQMFIPYRNSVLTSLFRPFFIGRGRTILCCNVNPCATFINQTNDLLKFCALAQKTIVVPSEMKNVNVIRIQRKPTKRLGRESQLKKKIHRDESTIDFWKFSLKKSLELLEKQAANRRSFLIDRHNERVKTVEYFLRQNAQLEHLKENLRREQNEHRRTQQNEKDLRNKLTQIERTKSEEIQRLKRDIGLELYRKQEMEKKCRNLEEKLRNEQNENQKIQLDFNKMKHELNTIKVKFDALQFEMDELKKKPSNESIKMFDDRTSTRSKRRTDDENQLEKHRKKVKRISDETNPYGVIDIETIPRRSNSPIYATIQRKRKSIEKTPKSSTFQRIQSLFRPTPTGKTKMTSVAFGSSTPTNRIPSATTPPKSRYNLRKRIFQNPTSTEKSQLDETKKVLRTRK